MKKLIVILLVLCLLSGCSLAVQGSRGADVLTGLFVTVSRNGETVWNGETAGTDLLLAGQKLRAGRMEGNPVVYEMPEGCGLSCFSYNVDGEGYRNNTVSPEIDVTLEFHAGTESPYRMDAVVYGTGDPDLILTCYQVYQTPDGDVYALSDDPAGFAADMVGSVWYAQEERTDGRGCAVSLTIEKVVLPETYVILEMDESHQIRNRAEFTPGELPEIYTPGADTAYIILEARAGEDTARFAYGPGDASAEMDTYYPGAYGLCIRGYTTIDWEGA